MPCISIFSRLPMRQYSTMAQLDPSTYPDGLSGENSSRSNEDQKKAERALVWAHTIIDVEKG